MPYIVTVYIYHKHYWHVLEEHDLWFKL